MKIILYQMQDRCKVKQVIMEEGPRLNEDQQRLLTCEFSRADVKRVLMSIPNDKAPGLDGYNNCFFKNTGDILGDEVSDAVLDFFRTWQLLKSVNVTTITLIPKVKNPASVSDYRPIACCSVIYKCITKLLCEQLRLVLPSLVANTQGAFVPGRSIILHNILFCQDLVKM